MPKTVRSLLGDRVAEIVADAVKKSRRYTSSGILRQLKDEGLLTPETAEELVDPMVVKIIDECNQKQTDGEGRRTCQALLVEDAEGPAHSEYVPVGLWDDATVRAILDRYSASIRADAQAMKNTIDLAAERGKVKPRQARQLQIEYAPYLALADGPEPAP